MSLSGTKLRKRLVKALLPPLRAVSPRLAGATLNSLGVTGYTLIPGARQRYLDSVRAWSLALGADWPIESVARALAGNELRFLSRDLALDGADEQEFDAMVAVEGREHLDRACAAGKGVVLLVSHFGSQMLPAHWLVRRGYPLRLYMERPNSISKLLGRHFADDSPLGQARLFISRRDATSAEAAGSVMRAVQVLKAGMVLCLAGDVRWSGAQTVVGRFLGVAQSFTTTWLGLASMTGAAVVPAFARMDPGGRFVLEFQPPFAVERAASSRGEASARVQAFLDLVEQQVRLSPENAVEYLGWPELLGRSPSPVPRAA